MLTKFYEFVWSWSDNIKDKIKSIGDYLQIYNPMFFFMFCMFTMNWHLLLISGGTFLLSIGVYLLLNAVYNNTRPRETPDLNSPPDMNVDWSPTIGNSFPSGHTMGAFAGGIWWFQIGIMPGIIGTLLGIFTGFSRIAAKAHWVRDVLTSICIATLFYAIAVFMFL